jgi:hypothetical protein
LVERADRVLLVDESRECSVRTVIELATGVYTTGILSCGDNFEILIL